MNLVGALDFAPPIAAGIVLLLVFGAVSMIVLPILALASLALMFYKRKIGADNLYKYEIRESAKALRAIHGSLRKGVNVIRSIEEAAQSVAKGSSVGDLLLSIRQRILLGQDLSGAAAAEAAKHAKNSVVAEALGPLRKEYDAVGSVNESAASSAISLEKRGAELRANEDGRLPRYLIMAMVASTILPSMATFAFVGYSILYYSSIFLMLYCAVLLGVLPNLYSAVRLKLSGLYNG